MEHPNPQQHEEQTTRGESALATPIELIVADHEQVKSLFADFHRADGESQEDIVNKISDLLVIHTVMEEQAFYPKMREFNPDLVKHSIEEHDDVDKLLVQLVSVSAMSPEFSDLVAKLEQSVEEHVMEEEDQLLPQAEDVLADQFEAIALDMIGVRENINPSEVRQELIQKYRND
jgi:hemerythrin superfamily protein